MRAPLPLVRARQAVRRRANHLLGRLRTASYIRKWLVLGVLIGIVAGVGALVFFSALTACTHWILGALGGFHPATTAGEGGFHVHSAFARRWAIPLVVALGGLVSGVLVFRFAPEAEGHGTDAAIDAVHNNPTGMRPRATVVKIVTSAVTIGSGGSGGREGPTAQISASFGSILARALNLSPADARIAVSTGIASGIGAIFRAPLGGAILGAELLYREDVEIEALIPSIVASIVAFAVFGSVVGFSPIFGYQDQYRFAHVHDLVWFAVIGIAAGFMGRLYTTTFYGTAKLFSGFRALPRHVRPAVGGLLVGGIGLGIPAVLGTGYGFVQESLDRNVLLTTSWWLVLAVPFAKILATSLSIGSGGSGGIFGPGMVIGGATGAAVWRLLEGSVPWVSHSPAPYVIVGMISCFGAIAHAPIAVMLMVAEMTGNLSLLAPAMVALALSTLVVGDVTIYRSQLRNRAEAPAHRLTFGMPLAATIPITDVMAPPRLVLPARTTVGDALAEFDEQSVPGAPVVNASGEFIGSVHSQLLRDRGLADTVGRTADAEAVTVSSEANLDAAMQALATSRGDWVPVLDGDMHVVGIVGTTDLVRGYRLALRASLRRLGSAAKGSTLVEATVGAGSPAAGRTVAQLALPPHTVIVAVARTDGLHFADGDTQLRAGDTISVLTRPESRAMIEAQFGSDDGPHRPHHVDSLV